MKTKESNFVSTRTYIFESVYDDRGRRGSEESSVNISSHTISIRVITFKIKINIEKCNMTY